MRPAGQAVHSRLTGRLPHDRFAALYCRLRRQDPQGRQAGWTAGRATHQVWIGHQPQDGEGAGVDDPAVTAGASGSADRI